MANGLTADIVGSFLRGRQARNQQQMFEQQLAQQKTNNELAQQKSQTQGQVKQLSGEILSGKDQDAKLQELFSIDPDAANKVLKSVGLLDQRQRDQAANFANDLIGTAPDQRNDKIQARAQALQAQGRSADETLALTTMPVEQQDQVLRTIEQASLSVKDRINQRNKQEQLNAKGTGGESSTAQIENFKFLSQAANLDEQSSTDAARIALGLEPRARGSAIQTIAAKGIAETIAETESVIAEGKESGKIQAGIKLKPQMEAAVATAKAKAKADGETFTELRRMEASMPGLVDTMSQLKGIAPLVTSTLGGRAFDAVVKETGFGATKGADARAKFISMVDNQVLPLLKQTFGAAFTAQEGESLKKSVSDPNASPSQKILQIEAFIDQKVRNIQSAQRELGQQTKTTAELNQGADQGQIMVDANGNRARVYSDGRIEEL